MKRINPFFHGHSKGFVDSKDKSIKKSRSEGQFGQFNTDKASGDNLKLDFAEWFTWCHTCKHAGHLDHMEEWFSTHTECPIPDCHCQCVLSSHV